ncbi:Angiotensin-converting enzyme, partial [Operophtera brumata]
MKSLGYLIFSYILSLLSCPLLCGTSSSGDDRRWLVSLVDLVELDYVDQCEKRSSATWSELTGDNKGLSLKLERDKAYSLFVREQATDVKSAITAHSLAPEDNLLRRKVKLIMQPGDAMLETEQWIRICRYDFCWSASGRIFLRKAVGSAPIIITSEQQLEDLKQKNG